MKNQIILLTILIFLMPFCEKLKGQDVMIHDLKRDSIPIGYRYNLSEDSYQHYNVRMSKNGIAIEIIDNRKYPVNVNNNSFFFPDITFQRGIGIINSLKIQNGYIVSNNRGESGGDLYFVSLDKRESSLIAFGITASGLHNYADKIIVLNTIFSSVSSGKGEVLELYYDEKWRYRKISNLPEAPILSSFISDILVIVASNQIYLMDNKLGITKIIKLPISIASLYPTSICGTENEIFIGMRSGVMRVVNPKSASFIEWYNK